VKLTTNKSQLAFIAEHPEMSRDYQPPEKEKREICTCEIPDFAFVTPSMRIDRTTYFNFCRTCRKFRDVPAPQPRVLTF
jgi:hypothetical protein